MTRLSTSVLLACMAFSTELLAAPATPVPAPTAPAAVPAVVASSPVTAPIATERAPEVMKAETMRIDNAWIRATTAGMQSTAAYMMVTNTGEADDALLRAECSGAGMVDIHNSIMENGVSRMVHVDRLALPKGKVVTLAPNGLHIMLMQLPQALAAGTVVPCTLYFEKHTPLSISIPVVARN